MATQLRKRRGFSLIDLLVAFTVFAIALMCTLTIFPTTMKNIRKARLNLMATHVAQSALESVYNQSFATIASGTSDTMLTTTINGSQDSVNFHVVRTVYPLSSTLAEVTVTVTWTDVDTLRSTTMETLVADKS